MGYAHVALRREEDVVEFRCHTDGGPLTWTAAAHREFGDAFAEIGADPTIKVVILTGTGDAFCRGIDSATFRAANAGPPSRATT